MVVQDVQAAAEAQTLELRAKGQVTKRIVQIVARKSRRGTEASSSGQRSRR